MSTNVAGTLVDSLGNVWSNAPIQFVFQPTPSTPGPFSWSGGDYNPMPPIIATDVNGFFTIILPANSEIAPAGSYWQMIIGPNSTYPATVINLALTSGALDISALFTASGAVKQVQSQFIPRAYANNEVTIPPNSGQLYYNVTNKEFRYWESGNWVPLGSGGGGGGGMVYPPAGIALSTGSGWAASIDPALVARTDTSNTFSQPQTFNNNIDIHGTIRTNYLTTYPGGDLRINSGGPTKTIQLNYDLGSVGGAVGFYNGDGGQVGYVDAAGNVVMQGSGSFTGALSAASGSFLGGLSAASMNISGNLQTGSLQINGAAPAGYVLTSNGSTFTAQPPAPTTAHLVVNVDSVPARSYNQVYQNGSSGILIVSGAGGTASDKTASVQCFIGISNPPTISAFATTIGSSTNSGVVGWNFTVPPGWYYKISPNTLVHPGDVGVVNIYNWIETAVTIA